MEEFNENQYHTQTEGEDLPAEEEGLQDLPQEAEDVGCGEVQPDADGGDSAEEAGELPAYEEEIPVQDELSAQDAQDEDVQETVQDMQDASAEDDAPCAHAEEGSESELRAALDKAVAEAEDLKKKWYSVSAEYENYRKRTSAARAQAYTEGRKDVVVKLFPIADSLERALAACSDEKTKQGISMVVKNFEKLLEGERINVIAPVGEPFDANRCEAIFAVDPEEGEESGIVREVYAKGYEQDGKVLRFAQVLVTK